jgi:DNA-directed RNA polymerase subunit F
MKATLEFNLPDDKIDFECASKGLDFSIFINDLLNEIRAALKYESGEFAKCDPDTLEKVREWIFNEVRERQLPNP